MKHTVTTYADLELTVKAFVKGTFNVLFIIGSPGQSKSTIVRNALGPNANFIKGGSVTAFQLYRELWAHQNELFVLDDVEQMYRDKGLVTLLKALCETEAEKKIQWMTAATILERDGIPRDFVTKSRVVIILNDWDTLSDHVLSLEDRGLMVTFRPPVEEVLSVGRTFVKDKEVIRYVEKNRAFISSLSLRAMMIAADMKRAGLPWQESLNETLGIAKLMLVQEILNDPLYNVDERLMVKRWGERQKSRQTPDYDRRQFFHHKRIYEELRDRYAALSIVLPPPKGRKSSKKRGA